MVLLNLFKKWLRIKPATLFENNHNSGWSYLSLQIKSAKNAVWIKSF